MRLLEIYGNICELTNLWASPYDKIDDNNTGEVNWSAARGQCGACRGSIRFLAGGKVRSRADALIEIKVNNLPRQEVYVIYYDKKGFYCTVQKRKVYLKDIITPQPPAGRE